jgi:O-acetyl-ADP-ribose deacetylase (regulator of RNase III)
LIEYVQGSLIEAQDPIIGHGCNSQGEMGAGVAKLVKERWPKVFTTYQYACVSGGLNLGDVVWGWRNADETKLIGNVITQRAFGKRGQRYVSYDALEKGLRMLATRSKIDFNDAPVGIPLIGAGHGGGAWRIIEAIILQVAEDTGVKFKVYVPDQAAYEKLTNSQQALV